MEMLNVLRPGILGYSISVGDFLAERWTNEEGLGECVGYSKSALWEAWEGDEVIRKGFSCHSEIWSYSVVGGEGEERDVVQDISETKQQGLMNDCHEQEGWVRDDLEVASLDKGVNNAAEMEWSKPEGEGEPARLWGFWVGEGAAGHSRTYEAWPGLLLWYSLSRGTDTWCLKTAWWSSGNCPCVAP